MSELKKILVIGGGMIVHDQALPSLLHLRRLKRLGEIEVCAVRESTLERLRQAFPNGGFQCVFDYRKSIFMKNKRDIRNQHEKNTPETLFFIVKFFHQNFDL